MHGCTTDPAARDPHRTGDVAGAHTRQCRRDEKLRRPALRTSLGRKAEALCWACAAALRATGVQLAAHGAIPLACCAKLTFVAVVLGGLLPVRARPGRELAWSTMRGGKEMVRWRYVVEPAEGGTVLTESFECVWLPLDARFAEDFLMRDRDRRRELAMRRTLERIKAASEAPAPTG